MTEPSQDLNYGVTNFIFDGNELKPYMPYRLSTILGTARKMKQLSMRSCQLEDDGLITLFEALSYLRELKKVDFSSNRIHDKGLEGLTPFIGGYYGKTALKSMSFNNNCVTTRSLVTLFEKIEKTKNVLTELNFAANDLTNDAAQFVSAWLKQMRMSDVDHSMNIIVCDLTQNKIMYRYLKDVESDLNVNRRYKQDAKNRKIQSELK
mmetsp:Transcript_8870/g.12141  ORF Transcript_8870/g.12141 Transcript_8870/m.12141 type:complete len:207 (+) Transcript_8870:1095-1715(+)|eukprot:CAMPEP_0185574370 /NCGR_PEP_ID=MMETSP0434-20130131/5855_1 /TAXON_ID=626734 ORGANISM="Favella taraikaensis, Strain Fe Narragansett Bay" /NCGR_SAMPLE_ID=MMETSP0434 /ASSEMBLY_ACC=CAM_ASM_000379 /LENGTH=206 /DNA_ID=CAMNT_0028190917 /DNA_START=1066 /DNA_END=1686 /DNA_ORIENTATION=-